MKKVISIFLSVIFIALIPLAVFTAAVFITPRFDETYYGELECMYRHLENAGRKKIIIIGTSSVAFGVDSGFIERNLNDCGLDYEVCNFGLYGAIGSKVMLELAEDKTEEGDIIIFAPEPDSQALSEYFSPADTFKAVESDLSLIRYFEEDERKEMLKNAYSFAADKFKYFIKNEKAQPSGVYARSSFDSHCDLLNYERSSNIMPDKYNADVTRQLSDFIPSDDYFDYINCYAHGIEEKGGKMYYAFCPCNRLGILDLYDENGNICEENLSEGIDDLYDTLDSRYSFAILGNPHDSFMSEGWFYDSNVHLNESGMRYRSIQLLDYIKTELGCTVRTDAEIPEEPDAATENGDIEGNEEFEEYFSYYLKDDGTYEINGYSSTARFTSVILPVHHDGILITSFSADTFQNNIVIKEVTVQKNIRQLKNGCFDGCTSLTKIILDHDSPSDITVGYELLESSSQACIYVHKSCYGQFVSNYTWGYYAGRLKKYG